MSATTKRRLFYLVALVCFVFATQGGPTVKNIVGARWGPAVADLFGLVLGGVGALFFLRAYRLSKTQSKKDEPPTRS